MLGNRSIGSGSLLSNPRRYYISATQTREGKERLRAYYEALGRFVDMFARVETAMTLTLWHYAKTAPEIAKIVHAGTKVIDTGADYIKQLVAVTNTSADIQADIKDVTEQLRAINKIRNHILHYGAEMESIATGRAIVSNAYKAKNEPLEFPIGPTDLDNMTADLRKIAAHLNERHLGKDSEYTMLSNPTDEPWRYKRPVPKPEQPTKSERRQARKLRVTRPPQPRS